jgi:hypothetical protein
VACAQLSVARRLLGGRRHRDGIQQAQRLLRLPALECDLRIQQGLLGHLLR